ncbi:BtpA/SgcQ family protein [Staphylothermus hellenicus]|uniref:Photosystem I assembly BtpA n=1 Tax=Staphylothermus hellenicus (strain DSM 12710 / JCM 10830 / BK20S6-10-b1 / P8) TaxID=591019 RepID=D7DBF3_STAHD|nr:BtpA/SgcQ family protein [Staphylothermus hellenicus]ADI31500.1 photosystem I assembly BtpA [Staphylothermus hellenicus DSM 12710]
MKLYGMVHLPPLPNSPQYRGEKIDVILKYAINEAEKLVKAGFDGVVIENYMDYPFPIYEKDPVKLRLIEYIARKIREKFPNVLVGLNILRNSGLESLDIACRNNLDFIRVNVYMETVLAPEGIIKPLAYELIKYKERNGCNVKVYADVNVKHSQPLMSYTMVLRNMCSRGLVDGVIVSGEHTGYPTPVSRVYVAKKICSDKEIIVGSGVNHQNIGLYIGLADAVIVGTSIKNEGITSNPVNIQKAMSLVKRVRRIKNRLFKGLGINT